MALVSAENLPALAVDVVSLRTASSEIRSNARDLRDRADSVTRTWSGLPEVFAMTSATKIFSAMAPVDNVADDYADALQQIASVLESFAESVALLQAEKAQLADEISLFRSTERHSRDLDPTEFEFLFDRLDSQNDGLNLQVAQLHSRFENLEQDCVASIRRISGGLGHGLSLPSGNGESFDQKGMPQWQWQSQADAFATDLGGTLMTTLATLSTKSAAEVRAWLAKHPKFIAVFAECPPPTDQVAAWWKSMGATEAGASALQYAFVSAAPAMIGNLNGVAFWARDSANRISLTRQLSELASAKEEMTRMMNAEPYSKVMVLMETLGFQSASQLMDYELALNEIRRSLEANGNDTFQLVNFITGNPNDLPRPDPLAAISVGDLDAATQVTVTVPGMGATVQSSMREWTAASANLYEQQRIFNSEFRTESSIAVVSWIGYDTPKMPLSIEVLSSDKAQVGARRLSDFLDGVTASHGWLPGQNLSIVAHSYGTTTATLAVAETPVENLTLLASAGLDESISSISDLKVNPDNVWASEADADHIADIGRRSRDHAGNPTDAAFAAQVFSSESSVVAGQSLHGSDGHSSAPQVKAVLTGKATEDWGYLDKMTTPLYNTGLTSLGLGHTGSVVVK